ETSPLPCRITGVAMGSVVNMRRVARALAAGLVLSLAAPSVQAAMVFSDGFEGPTLDPFWTMDVTNGSITVPSTAAAHGGASSAQFNSTSGGNRYVFLRHDFAAPVFGTASVWVFDTGANLFSSNYFYLQLENTLAPTYTASYIQSF